MQQRARADALAYARGGEDPLPGLTHEQSLSALGIEDREGNPIRIADTAGNSPEELAAL